MTNPRLLATALADDHDSLTKYIVQSGQIEDRLVQANKDLVTANGLLVESRNTIAGLMTRIDEMEDYIGEEQSHS